MANLHTFEFRNVLSMPGKGGMKMEITDQIEVIIQNWYRRGLKFLGELYELL